MESCGMSCLKWLVFFFNFLFLVCGCALLGLGIWVIVDARSISAIFENTTFLDVAYPFIVVGVALIIISFLGCCGAVKENRCMLGTFFAIVLLIFIVEIVVTILAFAYYPQVSDFIKANMKDYIMNGTLTKIWNDTQSTFMCCGFDSSENWENFGPYPINDNNETILLPESCCNGDSTLEECILRKKGVYPEGCASKFASYYLVIGGVGIGVLVVELLAMIFACCLYRAAGKQDNYA